MKEYINVSSPILQITSMKNRVGYPAMALTADNATRRLDNIHGSDASNENSSIRERMNTRYECFAVVSILYNSILYTDEVAQGYAAVSANFKTPKEPLATHCRFDVVYTG